MHPALRAVPAARHRIAATLCVLLALLTTAVAISATPAAPGRPPHTAVAVEGAETEAQTAEEVGAESAECTHAGLRADTPGTDGRPARATAGCAHLGERPSAPEHHATVPHTTGAARVAGMRAPEAARTPAPPGPPLHDRNRAPPVPPGT